MYDLIVIGGGPAGASAAIIAARSDAGVLLLERGKFPRHKVCGEFVSAESLALLASLLEPNAAALLDGAIRISQARVYLDGRMLHAPVAPAAASIARLDLDAALWHAAELAGVDTRYPATVHKVSGHGPFNVLTSHGDFEGQAVINASGRWSNLTAGVHSNGDSRWIGLKAHFKEPSPANSVDLYFFEGGYCGVQPVNVQGDSAQGRVNACAMVRSDVATSLPEVLTLHPALQERALHWQPLSEPVSTSPLHFHQPQPVRDGVLMAGDAVAFVDPFVGDGISLALRSGALAAESLAPFFASKIDLAEAAARYRDACQQRLATVYRMSSRIRRMLVVPCTLRGPILALLERTPALTRYLITKTR